MVPHWLTEGLAVRNEGGDRPASWMQVLRSRFASGQMLDLDTITLAFVRPRAEDDWPMAYCQALLYVEYTTKTYGEGAVGKLLAAYRAGGSTAAVLKKALGAEKADFEAGYRKYVEEVVKASGPSRRRPEKPLTFAELEVANTKEPDDLDVAARLAGEYLRRNKPLDAKKLADEVLAKEKGHPTAAIVKARILTRDKDADGARAVLELAAKENPDDARVWLVLGRAYIEAKELEKAADAFEKGRKAAPQDTDWLTELARIYASLDKTAELTAILRDMATHDPDEAPARLNLARLLLKAGKAAESERFAREALLLDLTNHDAREALLEALRAQKKDAEADKIVARFGG